jgi:AAA ATPase-like protein
MTSVGRRRGEVGQPETVADRLRRARRRHFVGRAGELELVRSALQASEPSIAVLFVHGPGGVGKTALLGRVAETAGRAGLAAWPLDLRGVEASPPGFRAAVAGALGVAHGMAAASALRGEGRRVLLLDTFEAVGGLEDWVREQFLPEVGANTLVVIAGREPPGADWLADGGWRELLRVVSLRNLPPGDARALLRAEGVATACTTGRSRSRMGTPSRSRCWSTRSSSEAIEERMTRGSSSPTRPTSCGPCSSGSWRAFRAPATGRRSRCVPTRV